MSWMTTLTYVDADGAEHRLAHWLGSRSLNGWRAPESNGRSGGWVGTLPEVEIVTSELKHGFPDRYEVTISGALTALENAFPQEYRDAVRHLNHEPDVEALEATIQALPDGTLVRVLAWDQL